MKYCLELLRFNSPEKLQDGRCAMCSFFNSIPKIDLFFKKGPFKRPFINYVMLQLFDLFTFTPLVTQKPFKILRFGINRGCVFMDVLLSYKILSKFQRKV